MSRNTADHQRRLANLLRQPENRECCDCSAKQPSWASTNLGVFFCLRCAGLHRALGTHVSKVKSTTMDTWEEDMIRRCEAVGNARGQILYEHNLPQHVRPNPSSNNAVVERFIRDKYERKLYYHPQYEELLKKFMLESADTAKPKSTTNTTITPPPKTETTTTNNGASVPMLWGGACPTTTTTTTTTTGSSTPAGNKDVKSGINMDDLFTPTVVQSNPHSQQQLHQPQQPQQPQQVQQMPWSNGAVGNTVMMMMHTHQSYSVSPQANYQTTQVDAKAEIMSLFSSPSTHHSNHVYSAWQPKQSSPGCHLSQ
ncbi:ADP-ribosylation factor GTPase activating protein [Trypanosoma theileri]|uniref:ADP-ribosylation factor GTPase activating protein n=1 Tax=Trypanosoma theileri TaxID=67003 RepID=A0A1X0NR72_9TRYP|nr:ADP-ribosylation factor GTPase activating protein [Trypanosoma theileri]ORC87101.1 ADP-ribosylation factor GTPase activating protein [Trypanosoma theileri]